LTGLSVTAFINDHYEKVYGLNSDKVLGQTVTEIFGEDIFQKGPTFYEAGSGR
jgi:hypothetical protein